MKKIEQVFREILYQAMEKDKKVLTQLELSRNLGFSLSTVNLAVKKLERMNAVRLEKMNFKIINVRKILYYWASIRNFEKDVVYRTRVEMPVREIEREMPDAVFAAYSAYKFRFNDVPADYSEVYVYVDIEKIKKRFPEKEKTANLFVLKKDSNLDKYPKTGTLAQIFVDLWNLKQWYASDFLEAVEDKINLKLK